MRFTSLDDWLSWLEHHHPKKIDLGLTRIKHVAEVLEVSRPRAKIITVAGTNGKGSCVATLEQLLLSAGYRVGAYTSPHLMHYCERIRIQGSPVSEQQVCAAFAKIDRARGEISLTYFEFATLAAVELFSVAAVDVMVLEVGLGGRLDAVNAWDAEIAIVTTIAIDHENWLGSDRESIGREKAGIFRRRRPAICGDAQPPASIANRAADTDAPLFQLGTHFTLHEYGSKPHKRWSWWGRNTAGKKVEYSDLPLPKLPLSNVATAIQAAICLGVDINGGMLTKVVERLFLPGRGQEVRYCEMVLTLDVAHNPAAAAYLAQRFPPRRQAGARTLAIVAMMGDKDCKGTLAAMLPVVDQWYVANLPEARRAATADDLLKDLKSLGVVATSCATVAAALTQAVNDNSAADRIVVFGSFLTVEAAVKVCQGYPLNVSR